MEFRFNLNELFKEPIVEVGNTLIPPGFTGDKRALWDVQSKMSQIINAIGEASAHAQGLSKAITTADRLRNSEYKLYLLMDPTANNGKGAVTGMLKTGTKGLYVFDRNGQHYQVSPQCVLDFYIHESRQRTGLGRRLFEHMLQRQQIEPEKMAIDRPSDKFLGFLSKHYGLNAPVKQMNNYVVYDGFFPKTHETPAHVDVDKSNPVSQKQSANGLQQGGNSILPSQTYGRYGAAHRPCSMGQIIHNDSAVVHRTKEPTGHAYQTSQSLPNVPLNYPSSLYNAYGQAAAGDYDRTLVRAKEPLIPQAFDGSLRKGAHALHGSASAPVAQVAPNAQSVAYLGSAPQVAPPVFQTNQPTGLGAPQSATQFTPMRNAINVATPQQCEQFYQVPATGQMNQQTFQTGAYQPMEVASPQSATQFSSMANEANCPTGQYHQAPPSSQMYQQNYQTYSTPEANQSGAYQPIGVGSPQSATQFPPMRNEENFPRGQYHQAPPSSQMYQQNYQPYSTPEANQSGAYQPIGVGSPQSATQFPPMRNEENFPRGQYHQAPPSSQMSQENYQTRPTQEANQSAYQPIGMGSPQSATQFPPMGNEANFPMGQYQQAPPSSQMSQQNHQTRPTQEANRAAPYQPIEMGSPQSATQFPPMRNEVNFPMPQYQQAPPASQMSQQNYQTRPIQEANQSTELGNPGLTPQSQHYPGSPSTQTTQQMGFSTEGNQPMGVDNPPVPTVGNSAGFRQMGDHNYQAQAFGQPTGAPSAHLLNSPGQTQTQLANQSSRSQTPMDGGPEFQSTSRVIQNYVTESPQLSKPRDPARSQQSEVDLSKGYPPQHFDEATPKADRPNSLNFEPPPEEKLSEPEEEDQTVDELIEEEIQKVTVAPEMERRGSKSPGPEAAGLMTPRDLGTQGLTDEGYFDLKFFHNRLW